MKISISSDSLKIKINKKRDLNENDRFLIRQHISFMEKLLSESSNDSSNEKIGIKEKWESASVSSNVDTKYLSKNIVINFLTAITSDLKDIEPTTKMFENTFIALNCIVKYNISVKVEGTTARILGKKDIFNLVTLGKDFKMKFNVGYISFLNFIRFMQD